MSHPKIFSLIKTPCGRAKYSDLFLKKGVIAKLRLYWFIFFAVIKDWHLKNPDHIDESNS